MAQQQPEPPGPDEVAGLVQQLASGDDAARREAYERLARLGASRREELRPHLSNDDPQVRFHILALLSEADAAVEQRVRTIVEGRPGYCATYPEAMAARADALVLQEPDVADRLVRLVRRRADGSPRGERYASAALDLLADRLRYDAGRGAPASAELATAIATLCELDLRGAFDDLAQAMAALPPERGHAALRSVIASGTPLARARAARVLAEIADAAHAQAAARAIAPLLQQARPEVRLAALRAFDILPLADPDLVQAAGLALDRDTPVAEAALRMVGQRRLLFAREAAERAAADATAPDRLRWQAIRTLGLLGVPSSADVLRPLLASDDPEMVILVAWALGAMHAPGAHDKLLELIGVPEVADERFYNGLARCAPEGVATLRALLVDPEQAPRAPDGGMIRAPRALMIAALGLARPPGAVAALLDVVHQPVAERMSEDGATNSDVTEAIEAIRDQRSAEASAALATLVIESFGPWQGRTLEALVPIVGDIGPPDDPALKARLVQALERCLMLSTGLRDAAAMALVGVDRARAREVLSKLLAQQGGRGTPGLLHAVARAGDAGPARSWAVLEARSERDAAQGDLRFQKQNEYGIELLYADLLADADLEFRRMLWCKPTDDTAAYNVACGHALGGRAEEALRALRRAVRNGFDKADHMAADTDLRLIRSDPRFQRILDGMFLEVETGLRAPRDDWPRARAN